MSVNCINANNKLQFYPSRCLLSEMEEECNSNPNESLYHSQPAWVDDCYITMPHNKVCYS